MGACSIEVIFRLEYAKVIPQAVVKIKKIKEKKIKGGLCFMYGLGAYIGGSDIELYFSSIIWSFLIIKCI